MNKERWFNYRPICLIFAFLLLGSVFAFFVNIIPIVLIISAVSIFSLLFIIGIRKKKLKYFIVPLIAFIIGVSAYYLTVVNFNKGINYIPSSVEARISLVGKPNDNYLYVEADSCFVNNTKISEKIIIYIYDTSGLYEDIEIGSKIKFTPTQFYHAELIQSSLPRANYINENIKYISSVNITKITFNGVDKTFAEIIKQQIKNNLLLGLTNENAEIAYSSLFGEKDLLGDNQYSAYKLSGVAHLLAVSGLHVGIITAVLLKLLDIFKVKRWWRFGIVGSFLLLYMSVCNFAVSIVRATIMAMILMMSEIFGEEYDTFNSISIAGIVCYIINPLCVFDVSFLMSFGCVLGIAILYKPILKMLILKLHFPNTFASAVAMSLSTTITLVFIMAFFFNTLNIIAIIANVILIPIFTVAFIPIFIISLLSLIIPQLSYLLFPINYILNFINICATLLGGLAISNFNTLKFNYLAIVVYFILLLIIGRLCTAKYQYKILISLPILALLVCCLL